MLLCEINLADAFMPFFSQGERNYNNTLTGTRNRFSKRKYRCRPRQLDDNAY